MKKTLLIILAFITYIGCYGQELASSLNSSKKTETASIINFSNGILNSINGSTEEEYPPKYISADPTGEEVVEEGNDIDLMLTYEANPDVTQIKVMHNGGDITDIVTISILGNFWNNQKTIWVKIEEVEVYQSGDYSITITNKCGSLSRNYTVTVIPVIE